jgi:5'(3')-deoxyribonucleotidase
MQNIVWIDLDGVMVDLERGLMEKFNFKFPKERSDYNKTVIDNLWDDIGKNHPTFWVDLNPLSHYKTLYEEILKTSESPIVLSATPEPYTGQFDEDCRQQKTQWVAKHLGLAQACRTIITKSKLKQDVIAQFPNCRHILIDDHPGNIERWFKAGGSPIHHTNIESTIKALKEFQ